MTFNILAFFLIYVFLLQEKKKSLYIYTLYQYTFSVFPKASSFQTFFSLSFFWSFTDGKKRAA